MTSSRVRINRVLVLALLLAAPLALADQKDDLYNKGMAAINAGDSIGASLAFCALPADFKDAGAQCTQYKPLADRRLTQLKVTYSEGLQAMQSGDYATAEAKFRLVKYGDYVDQAKQKIQEIAKLKADAANAAQQSQAAEQANKQKLDSGTNAFLAGRMDEAKATLSGVTGSHQAEAQAVLLKITNYQAAIAKGKVFEGTKDFVAAKNAYAEAVNINPSGPATDLLTKAAAEANTPAPVTAVNNPAPTIKPPAPVKQVDVAAFLRDGQKALAKKDYKKAKRYFQEVLGQEPKNQEATDALAQINSQDTSTVQASDDDPQLRRYIEAFYLGQYATAEQLLNAYIFNTVKGKGKLGLANFYLGASMLTRYYLAGANDPSLRNEALSKFKAAKAVDGFKAPDKFVSPKIMKAFQEVS